MNTWCCQAWSSVNTTPPTSSNRGSADSARFIGLRRSSSRTPPDAGRSSRRPSGSATPYSGSSGSRVGSFGSVVGSFGSVTLRRSNRSSACPAADLAWSLQVAGAPYIRSLPNLLRIAVIAEDPLARSGLVSLLGPEPDVVVVGQARTPDDTLGGLASA